MHTVYKAVPFEDTLRIVDYCRHHDIKNGGLFEVYPGPDGQMFMVVVNSCSEDGSLDRHRPLGAFYCNYMSPGVITLEEDDPHFGGAEPPKRHVQAIKQVIDILLREGFPGTRIRFNDLPALRG